MKELKKSSLQVKRDCVKAVLTRLKPNDIPDRDSSWSILEKGLYRLSISQLDSLQDLISNKLGDDLTYYT